MNELLKNGFKSENKGHRIHNKIKPERVTQSENAKGHEIDNRRNPERVSDAGAHARAAAEHRVGVEVLSDVHVALTH